MMVISWEDCPYDLSNRPDEEQQLYLAECPAFDPLTSRADHRELGILTEYLRTRAGTVRSNHPECSFAATGSQANWVVQDHPLQYGYGAGSPLAKLYEVGGKVLSLGAPLNTLTLLHYAEYLAEVADKRIVRYKLPVWRDGKREWVAIEEFDTSEGFVDWEGEDYFELIGRDYLKSGNIKSGKVGAATAYLFEAVDLTNFAVTWMENTFQSKPVL
jgi:aminoglycoside 3-N-acetyltransferase